MKDLTKKTMSIFSRQFGNEEFVSYKKMHKTKPVIVSCFGMLLIAAVAIAVNSFSKMNTTADETSELVALSTTPAAATSSKTSVLSIPTGVKKANPFVPSRTIKSISDEDSLVMDVPKFDLIAPPDLANENSPAAQIMNTVVSGILFDKFSPSAILNIDGNDYLVKKGDVIHNYKVLNIAQNSVTVQLGSNTYKAGIGELITDGHVNYNEVSNLHKKFGGEQR